MTHFFLLEKKMLKMLNVIQPGLLLPGLIHPHVWRAGNVTSKEFTNRRRGEFAKSWLI